jgi:hypothetical protein
MTMKLRHPTTSPFMSKFTGCCCCVMRLLVQEGGTISTTTHAAQEAEIAPPRDDAPQLFNTLTVRSRLPPT